ncbi:EamA family transporter [Clostridium magnum]|uniref:EamA family transporter n=1 Tax=Clostridium magnum TaxID=33954 RepID=UPI001FA860FD|nr:EamA family transporter [Clostridium magnum]
MALDGNYIWNFIGFWDITKKKAFKQNSVVSVLAFYSIFCFIFVSFEFSNAINLSGDKILIIFIKTFIIFFSWVLGFTAIKQLPISIVTPFDTVNPLFSIILGIIILGESLGLLQGVGIVIMLVAYYFIGKVGSKEITKVFKNKYLLLFYDIQ